MSSIIAKHFRDVIIAVYKSVKSCIFVCVFYKLQSVQLPRPFHDLWGGKKILMHHGRSGGVAQLFTTTGIWCHYSPRTNAKSLCKPSLCVCL